LGALGTICRLDVSQIIGESSAVTYLVNRRQLTIEWGHCDPDGVVFNNRYFEFSDWSTALLFQAALGMNKSELMTRYSATMPLIGVRGRFIQPLKLADVVEIASAIQEFRQSSFEVAHQFFNQGELAAETHETRVWCSIDPKDPSTLKSKPFPPELMERFKAV
jgi:4-hydroxybenzoyl-CoA thioesterase